eukprot:gene10963-11117_t
MFKPEKLDHAEDFCLEVLLGNGASGLASSLQGGLPMGGTAGPAVLVLGCPTQPFTVAEFETLRSFLGGGGSLLVCFSEGGEAKAGTNINYLLEELGIAVNADVVVRTAQYKYLHPKEALISDGVANRAVLLTAGLDAASNGKPPHQRRGGVSKSHARHEDSFQPGGADVLHNSQGDWGTAAGGKGLDFVYPYGCTLSVQAPAVPLLSTGKISYPMQRPVAACWSSPEPGGGRLLVLGAAGLLDDAYLDKEDNSRISDFIFKWLRPGSKLMLHEGDAEDADIASDLALLPDTETLADRPKPCLAEVQELPRDWAKLFDGQLYSQDLRHVPAAVSLYEQLGVKKAPLGLIPPVFETPLPPLQPATFPPVPREPPPPALELFDLDEAFAGDQAQLASLLSKCKGGAADLEYFLIEAGQLAGLDSAPEAGAKGVLAELLRRLVQYKAASMDLSSAGGHLASPDTLNSIANGCISDKTSISGTKDVQFPPAADIEL